jgi:hypothetical protein
MPKSYAKSLRSGDYWLRDPREVVTDIQSSTNAVQAVEAIRGFMVTRES